AAEVVLLAHHGAERQVAIADHLHPPGRRAVVQQDFGLRRDDGQGQDSHDGQPQPGQGLDGERHGVGPVVTILIVIAPCRLLLLPLFLTELPMPLKPENALASVRMAPVVTVWALTLLPLLVASSSWSLATMTTAP